MKKLNSTTVFGYFKYADDAIVTKLYGISGGNLLTLLCFWIHGSYANSNGIDSINQPEQLLFG